VVRYPICCVGSLFVSALHKYHAQTVTKNT